MTVLQRVGTGIAIVSIAIGLCGMYWTIYPAFVAKEDADYAAIAPQWFDATIWFAITAVVGGAMGTALVVAGRHSEK